MRSATYCVLGLTLLPTGCGWLGRELLDADSSVAMVDDDSGVRIPPVGNMDASSGSMSDASDETNLDASADASADGAAFVDAGEPDAPVDAGPQPCDFAGTWASRTTIDVSWPIGTAIAAGRGTANVWVKYEATQEGGLVPGSMAVCGVSMPDFALQPLLGGERYGVDFDIPLFDAVPPRALSTDAILRIDGAGFPGDPMTLSETVQVLGTTLSNPLNDPWPSAGQLVNNDMDGDGRPGITIANLNDATHVNMRVDAFGTVRADRGYYASRFVMSWSGSVESCSAMEGEAEVTRFDTHIVGCRLVSGGECSVGQRNTLDGFRPLHRADSASFRSVKVVDGATCAVARSALQ